jgi:class 3 adenylate cyclase
MPIFMDVHENLGDVTEEDIKHAHEQDLAIQGNYGVQFLTFWFNSPDGQAFCLVDAPSKDAAIAVHKASHGLVPHDMVEVERPTVSRFMGDWERSVPNMARHEDAEIDTGLRAIMFTDLVDSTLVSSRDGDVKAMELVSFHDRIVREALASNRGREVKHTGDGIFASFDHVSTAVDCAVAIQRGFGEPMDRDADTGRVRIGISVGEPIQQHEDLFGAVVNLAARICGHAQPGQILVSSAVRELSVGKPISFVDRGPIALKGFTDPVRLFEVPCDHPSA